MYQCMIQFKNDLPEKTLHEMKNACDIAFNNRAGKVTRREINSFCVVYEGEEEYFGCLQLGVVTLDEVKGFKKCVEKWDWIDEEPDENHCILEALSIPIYIKGKCVNA